MLLFVNVLQSNGILFEWLSEISNGVQEKVTIT
jgi:hypothetical protein